MVRRKCNKCNIVKDVNKDNNICFGCLDLDIGMSFSDDNAVDTSVDNISIQHAAAESTSRAVCVPMDCINNELLSYIQHHLVRSSAENIKSVIIRFYTPEEISQAKSLLWKSVPSDSLGPMRTRVKSTTRLAHEADVDDVISSFQKIDSLSLSVPKFAAINLDRLPKYPPEQVSDAVVRDIVNSIEQRLRVVEARSEGNTDSINVLNMIANEGLKSKVSSNLMCSSSWPALGNESVETTCNRDASKSEAASKSDSRPSAADVVKLIAKPQRPVTRPRGVSSRAVSMTGAPAIKNVKDDYKEDVPLSQDKNEAEIPGDFEMTREQKRRIWRRERNNKAIVGKRENCLMIKSGLKNIDIFIFRVHKDVDNEDLKQFIVDEGISVSDFQKVSRDDSMMNSFKATIPFTDYDHVMSDSFWLTGIACRRFYSKRS